MYSHSHTHTLTYRLSHTHHVFCLPTLYIIQAPTHTPSPSHPHTHTLTPSHTHVFCLPTLYNIIQTPTHTPSHSHPHHSHTLTPSHPHPHTLTTLTLTPSHQLNRVKAVEKEKVRLEGAKKEAEEYLTMKVQTSRKQHSLYQRYMSVPYISST